MPIYLLSRRTITTPRRGFTLLELLVAMTLTLLLTALVVQVFTFVSDGVFNSRAAMDLSDQLRTVKHRMIADLRGITAPTIPPLDPCSDSGYIEIVEGPYVANYPGGDIGRDQNITTMPGVKNTVFGDRDDVLMFTTVSYDEEFVGKNSDKAGKSRYAEVSWFLRRAMTTNQVSGGSVALEHYNLHRRIWLVKPNANWGGSQASYANYDVSMHQELGIYERMAPNPVAYSNSVTLGAVASKNSLGDLTMRECRAIHQRNVWPFEMFYVSDGNNVNSLPTLNEQSNAKFANPIAEAASTQWPPYNQKWKITGTTGEAQYTAPNDTQISVGSGTREQSDIILTNVVGFDVKVWDPGAPVFRAKPSTTLSDIDPNPDVTGLISPGDPGYGGDGTNSTSTLKNPVGALQNFIANATNPDYAPVSFGAYVDMNYMWIYLRGGSYNDTRRANYLKALKDYEQGVLDCPVGTLPRPSFGFGNARNALSGYSPTGAQYNAVYDTWSRHYEYDGIDSDGDGIVDEGTDGIDNNSNGLIDEPSLDVDGNGTISANEDQAGETDAPPPFDVPLRGMKVTIRVMEQDSRQVREISIIHEFLPL